MEAELWNVIDRALLAVARRVGLLAAVTPVNAADERARLESAYSAGSPCFPGWRYRAEETAIAAADLTRDLDRVRRLVAGAGSNAGTADLVALYVGRCDELSLETDLVARVGSPAFGALAAKRFAFEPRDVQQLADTFAQESFGAADEETTSDGDEAGSLLGRVRALIGELRVPFRVEVRRELAPMAATGDGVVLIAAGRRLTKEAAARTAMHEVLGHVLPRARAAGQSQKLFAIGTARGADEQEGYALLLEERAGYLHHTRARELSARHRAVCAMRAGADFVECVRALRDESGCDVVSAVRIAERTFRGSDGRHAGLGREAIYLPTFARVRAHLAAFPEDEIVIASGQISTHAAPVLRAHVEPHSLHPLGVG